MSVECVITEPHGLKSLIFIGMCLKGRSLTHFVYLLPVFEQVRHPLDDFWPKSRRLALITVPLLAPAQFLSSNSKVRMFSIVSP